MNNKVLMIVVLILSLAFLSNAQVPQYINYQGVLADASGKALTGNYSINFRIYSASSGGSLLWGPQSHTVNAVDGIFSVVLGPIDYAVFSGEERWLSLQIGSDAEMNPRKRLLSVGYSFRAYDTDKVDGQELSTNDGTVNQSSDPVSWYKIKDIPSGFADGNDDVGTLGGVSKINVETGMTVTNPTGPTTTLGLNMGHGNNINSDMVDDKHASDFANSSHNHSGGNITSGKISNSRLKTGTGNGLDADMVDGKHANNFANSSHNHSGGNITSGKISNSRLNTGAGNGLDADLVDGKHASHLGADNLGNHTATQNIKLNGRWLSNDGGNEGIRVSNSGSITTSNGIQAGGSSGRYAMIALTSGAVFGQKSSGIHGWLGSPEGRGVYGQNGNRWGALGTSNEGAIGKYSSSRYGLLGNSTGGTFGQYSSGKYGWLGVSNGGAYGQSSSSIYGYLGTSSGRGVSGANGSRWGYIGGSSYAGYFNGPVRVTGFLTKSGGGFEIDHPLDPANKYLYHSFVESPDMMNIYNGNAKLDMNGEAWVDMPDYFQKLNKDHRYQLTAVGSPGPNLFIAEKISNNRFKIAGGTPGMEVSWQVTGVRQDAYANTHRMQVEVEKKGKEHGKYLQPEAHGMPKTMGILYDEWLANQQEVKIMNESVRAMEEEQKKIQEEMKREEIQKEMK